jgi:hypothetical protein
MGVVVFTGKRGLLFLVVSAGGFVASAGRGREEGVYAHANPPNSMKTTVIKRKCIGKSGR